MNRLKLLILSYLLANLTWGQDYVWPVETGKALSSNFGENRSDHYHMGLDIKTNGREGVPVVAIADGYISRIVANYSGYGKALYLTTGDGRIAVYAHLNRFNPFLENILQVQQSFRKSYLVDQSFQPGEFPVQKGSVIGYTGNTGASFAPHLHFELRTINNEPLNPLTNGYSVRDRQSPVLEEIAVIPLSQGTLINGNPLPRIFPIFRDKTGLYQFPDTLNCEGTIGLAIRAVDRMDGMTNHYQFHRAMLRVDGETVYEIKYDQLEYDQSGSVQTVWNHRLFRKNLGEFHKLYRLKVHPSLTIHSGDNSGILILDLGYHNIEITVWDPAGNRSQLKGVLFIMPPAPIAVEMVSEDNKVVTFTARSASGSLPLRSVTGYSFTPYGFADQKLDFVHQERVGREIHFTVPRGQVARRTLQFRAVNQLGAYSLPFHYTGYVQPADILNLKVDLEVSHTEAGIFLQVDTGRYTDGDVKVRLITDEEFRAVALDRIQPNVFLSPMLQPEFFYKTQKVVVLLKGDLEREIQFSFEPRVVAPDQTISVFSKDRLCSMQTTGSSLYDTTLLWIDMVEKSAPMQEGSPISKVYQLQPYELALKDSLRVGIRYGNELAMHEKLGIYAFDPRSEKWVYRPTRNQRKRRVLTAGVESLDAVAIFQDLNPPMIVSSYPAEGGHYFYQDVEVLKIEMKDDLSGIEATEASMSMLLDGKRLLAAYQPMRQELTYRLEVPLDTGYHELLVTVVDRAGNSTLKKIKFSIK